MKMGIPFLRCEPGYLGMFTREQAEGAIPNGTRIEKVNSDPGDSHPDGARGTVLGSFSPVGLPQRLRNVRFMYFVAWDTNPRIAVGIAGGRIRALISS